MSPDRLLSREVPRLSVREVYVAGNRGPCGGVNMALEAAYQVLEIVDGREPVYTNWDIVNNNPIMEELRSRGLVNLKERWTQAPVGSIMFFSAHGVPPDYHKIAQEKGYLLIDTTCQLVTRVHNLAIRAQKERKHVIYIGVADHPETIGVWGELDEENRSLVQTLDDIEKVDLPATKRKIVFSQTTLAPRRVKEIEDVLREKFRNRIQDPVAGKVYDELEIPDRLGICYATYNRQKAVLAMIPRIDMLIVVGSEHSHNSQELKMTAQINGRPSYLVDDPGKINESWFKSHIRRVGVTSGASVLDRFMEPVTHWIKERSPLAEVVYEEQVIPEKDLTFVLPEENIKALRARYNS